MKKKSIALAGAALVLGGLITPTAAYAVTFPNDCASGRICVYDYYDYIGQLGWRTAGFPLQNVSDANNDKMASWANHTSSNAAWFSGYNGGGDCSNMNANTVNSALAVLSRDKMSSWKGTGGC